jgi:hypothetical protein
MSPKSDVNSTGFATLGLDDGLVASVTALGYEEPRAVPARPAAAGQYIGIRATRTT